MFIPPFCPNPACPNHQQPQLQNWYKEAGSFSTRVSGFIHRYCCKTCHKGFSTQTFHLDYYVKKKINYQDLTERLSSGESVRAQARRLRCSPDTVLNRYMRAARQVIAFKSFTRKKINLSEDLVADGFESFVVSQYFPGDYQILVGSQSQYVYYLNHLSLRRKGRMTAVQKVKAAEYTKQMPFPEGEAQKSFSELVSIALTLFRSSEKKSLLFSTDEKKTYAPCLREARKLLNIQRPELSLVHQRINSRAIRNRANPLFSANYMDREIRKDLSEHHRETVCFARNLNNSVERMELYCFFHNYLKPFRINRQRGDPETHAEAAGIPADLVRNQMNRIFTQRVFLSRTSLSEYEKKLWMREYRTPLKQGSDYLPGFFK